MASTTAVDVVMPQMGVSVSEGTITKWTKQVGEQIAATIAEEAFEELDAPLKRIAAPDTPVPFSPVLEQAFIPQVAGVVKGLRELAEY